MPQSAFINVKSPRYRADTIIGILKRNKADSIDYIIGLTNYDISTTKRDANGIIQEPESRYEDWGVFGLGYKPGRACVVSTFRLQADNEKIFLNRLKKVCNHEIGHNLGLSHCTSNEKCVMKDAAESIRTLDSVYSDVCSYCRGKIK